MTPLGPGNSPRVVVALLKALTALTRAWNWWACLERGRVNSTVESARADGCPVGTVRFVTRILRLA